MLICTLSLHTNQYAHQYIHDSTNNLQEFQQTTGNRHFLEQNKTDNYCQMILLLTELVMYIYSQFF